MFAVSKFAAQIIFVALSISLVGILAFYLWQEFVSQPEGTTEVSVNPSPQGPTSVNSIPPVRTPEKPGRTQPLKAEREELDKTIWAMELAAQEHEQTIVRYWDRMVRRTDDKFAVLSQIPFESITLGAADKSETLDWGIERTYYGTADSKTIEISEWRSLVAEMRDEGYEIIDIGFHQSSFDQDPDGSARSTFTTHLHVQNSDATQRWIIKGDLDIVWGSEKGQDGLYPIQTLAFTDFTVLTREGPQVFSNTDALSSLSGGDVQIAYDIDRDGDSDILLPDANQLLRNPGDGNFSTTEPLFTSSAYDPPFRLDAAVVADFTGDGQPDLVCASYYETATDLHKKSHGPALILFRGEAPGAFSAAGQPAHDELLALVEPMCLSAGDVDGDGDLDLFLGQYKTPYKGGQMPTPFYDARDGYPAYLMLNDGTGKFTDHTIQAGLEAKRNRRTYSASFVDLDDDLTLDLIVVNDFAGVDVYKNDGNGHFTDMSGTMLDETSNFGMSHTFADYDLDGVLDLYVIGMSSTTMRRLNHMGLAREGFPDFVEMRTRLGYGNRMYCSVGSGKYEQPAFKDRVARSGWSWGATSFDFDSDGDMDIYVMNGHITGSTTKDYCTLYWTHDIYQGSSENVPEFSSLFREAMQEGLSWDGFQQNHLFMNLDGGDFINVAFLMDVAFIEDGRTVLSDDFDSDGRPDLLQRSIRVEQPNGPTNRSGLAPGLSVTKSSQLQLIRNEWPERNNWVGVRLYEGRDAPSPIGAKIVVKYDGGEHVAHIVTGDSYRAQHAPMKHFGLGDSKSVQYIDVRWPNGMHRRITQPAVNEYHVVK